MREEQKRKMVSYSDEKTSLVRPNLFRISLNLVLKITIAVPVASTTRIIYK